MRIAYILKCNNEIFAILFRDEKDEFISILAENMEDLESCNFSEEMICNIENDFYIIDENGVIKGLTALGQFCINCGLNRLIIPKIVCDIEVKIIGRDSFRNLNIETVILPEGLEKIDKRAFKDSKIEYLKIPDSIVVIEEKSFKDCVNLELVEFGENLKIIGSSCFYGCRSLTKVLLPEQINNVVEMAVTAFGDTGKFEVQMI